MVEWYPLARVWTDVPRERLREAVTAMAADSNGWKRLEKDQGSTVSACPALNERGEEFYRAFIWEITSWETPIAENLSYSNRWKRPEKGPAWWPAMNSLWHLDNCPESDSNGWKRLEKDLGSTISACPTLNESGEDFIKSVSMQDHAKRPKKHPAEWLARWLFQSLTLW